MVDNSVKGKTAVYGVIGCPIEHTFSPAIHNTMAKTLNKDMIYEAFRVEKDNLESAIKGAYSLGIKGLNVTVPHKVEVMKCLCDIDKRAKVIGAVNTLKYTENGYVGYNTDIIGVYYAIKNKGFDVKGKTVLLLGAGGAGNACGVMAADNGAKMLYIANRTVSKADKLAESIRAEYPDTEIKTLSIDDIYDIPNVDIVLNATVIGFGENKGLSPIKDTGFYKAKGVEMVFDAIYSPWETQLLKDCRKEGITGINGFDMLVYQAVAAEEIWFDEEIDPQLTEKARKELSVLIGFMGSGKTSVGKRLSLVLKREFIDTDDFIEKREGMTINEIFKEKGEEEFRKIERELYKRFSTPKKKIIATGGGVIKNPANIANLKKGGVIVYLKSSPEKIAQNLKFDNTRPILQVDDKEAKIRELLAQREPFYNKYAEITIDVSNYDIDHTVDKIIELAKV